MVDFQTIDIKDFFNKIDYSKKEVFNKFLKFVGALCGNLYFPVSEEEYYNGKFSVYLYIKIFDNYTYENFIEYIYGIAIIDFDIKKHTKKKFNKFNGKIYINDELIGYTDSSYIEKLKVCKKVEKKKTVKNIFKNNIINFIKRIFNNNLVEEAPNDYEIAYIDYFCALKPKNSFLRTSIQSSQIRKSKDNYEKERYGSQFMISLIDYLENNFPLKKIFLHSFYRNKYDNRHTFYRKLNFKPIFRYIESDVYHLYDINNSELAANKKTKKRKKLKKLKKINKKNI